MKPLTCPVCHQPVSENDYFCSNCGQNLKPIPLPTNIYSLFLLYIKCLLLPPMGVVWGIRYLKQKDTKSKITGLIAIIITVIILEIALKITLSLIDTVNKQVNSQLQDLGL